MSMGLLLVTTEVERQKTMHLKQHNNMSCSLTENRKESCPS